MTWGLIWLMLALKIPIVALAMIVRWAVKSQPETDTGGDGGIGPNPGPKTPRHPRGGLRRPPRRGPHGGPAPAVPPRVRAVANKLRLPRS